MHAARDSHPTRMPGRPRAADGNRRENRRENRRDSQRAAREGR